MKTPITKLLDAIDESMDHMKSPSHTKETLISVRQLIALFLYDEKNAIQKAFSDGQELCIHNSKLPMYSNEEYFNDNYKD